jgi:hypothetical protein
MPLCTMRDCSDRLAGDQQTGRNVNHGIAPIEFLMFLPFFVAFLLVILWVARVKNAELDAGREASVMVMAFAARMEDRDTMDARSLGGDLDAGDLQRLVDGFQPGMELLNGFASGAGEADSGDGIQRVVEPIGPVSDKIQYMVHDWEDVVFEFPQRSSQQPQLTLPKQIRGIAPGSTNLAAFARLQSFGGGTFGGVFGILADVGSSLQSAQARISQSLDQVNRQISRTEDTLRSLRDATFPDFDAIRQAESRLRTLREQRSSLREGQRQAGNALDVGV